MPAASFLTDTRAGFTVDMRFFREPARTESTPQTALVLLRSS
ncbi:hypothetical protein [Nocardia carnea]|nr:hypothetical protein [Nocardia carnea]